MLSLLLAAIMLVQSLLGLFVQSAYRDTGWVEVTWLGNDWFTFIVALPLLIVTMALARRGSVRGKAAWLGVLAYGVYNYAFYLFGASFNPFFPLYVAGAVISAAALLLAMPEANADRVLPFVVDKVRARVAGAALVLTGLGLTTVWLGVWAGYVFAGRPTPVETEVFHVVAAVDLALMVPLLLSGGALLWRQRPIGYLLGTAAAVQATLYLLVLSANSLLMIERGFAQAPGELPVWGSVAAFTGLVTLLLLRRPTVPTLPDPSSISTRPT